MDEDMERAYMALGLLRAAHAILEKADPPCAEARAYWHEAIRLTNKAVLSQWDNSHPPIK